jgi:hypothetical protein
MTMHPSPQAIRLRTWWLAALLSLALAVISAGGLILLAWGWFLVLPVWSMLLLVIAGILFAVSRVRPWALAYGIAVLGSLPLAIVFVIVFLAVASLH